MWTTLSVLFLLAGCSVQSEDLGPSEPERSLGDPAADPLPISDAQPTPGTDSPSAMTPEEEPGKDDGALGAVVCEAVQPGTALPSCSDMGAPRELLTLDPLASGEYAIDEESITLSVGEDSFDVVATTPVTQLVISDSMGTVACELLGAATLEVHDLAIADAGASVIFCGE